MNRIPPPRQVVIAKLPSQGPPVDVKRMALTVSAAARICEQLAG
jgi:hypothetical protein